MDCTQAQEEFAALLDGELAPEERAAVEGHLSQCSDCLRDLDGLKRVDTTYRQLSNVTAPEGFEERVREAIRPKPVLRFPDLRRRRHMKWPLVAAAAVFALVVGAVMLQFGLPTVEKEMTVASLEKHAAPPAPTAAAPAVPEEALPQTAMDAVAPMASPPAAEAPPPSAGVALLAKPEVRPSEAPVKSKGVTADVESDALHSPAQKAQAAPPPAAEPAPVQESSLEERTSTTSAEAVDVPSAAVGNTRAEVAAPAPLSSPSDLAKRRSAASIGIQSASPINEGAPPPEAKEELPKVEEIGKRLFEQRDGIWYESSYTDQKTTRLVRGSNELRKLVSMHSDLGKVLELGERIVFKADDKWYRVDPRAGR